MASQINQTVCLETSSVINIIKVENYFIFIKLSWFNSPFLFYLLVLQTNYNDDKMTLKHFRFINSMRENSKVDRLFKHLMLIKIHASSKTSGLWYPEHKPTITPELGLQLTFILINLPFIFLVGWSWRKAANPHISEAKANTFLRCLLLT